MFTSIRHMPRSDHGESEAIMIGTEALRRQHEEAEKIASAILDRLEPSESDYDSMLLARLVAKLNALLRIHFAFEDLVLYPAIIAAQGQGSAIACRFHEEMGGLAERFEDFARRWSSPSTIGAMFEDFREETLCQLAALAARIERENDLLYPLAEKLVGRRAA